MKENAVVCKDESVTSVKETEKFNAFKIRKKNKKVVLLGTAPSAMHAPFEDQSFDIWGVAHCCFLQPVTKLDMIFEIHNESIWRKDNAPFSRFPNATIIMDKKYPDIANSQEFPTKEILDKYKVNKGHAQWEADYQSSSLGYMVCLAIENGYEEIWIYGIHLLMEEEYFYQRPCFEYYLGIARGAGIKVFVHPTADILKFGYLYGFQEKESIEFIAKNKERLDEFDKRLQAIQNQKQMTLMQMDSQINQLIGAREDVVYQLRGWGKDIRGKDYVKF